MPQKVVISRTPFSDRQWFVFHQGVLLFTSVLLTLLSAMVAGNVTAVDATDPSSAAPSEAEGSFASNWIGLVVLGASLCCVAGVGIWSGVRISLLGMLWTFWLCVVMILPLLLFSVGCLNSNHVLTAWVGHKWDDAAFGFVRDKFCPDGTADTTCNSPMDGTCNADASLCGGSPNVTAWCAAAFNATSCAHDRQTGVDAMSLELSLLMNCTGLVGLVDVVAVLFSLRLCVRIITMQVVQASMNDIVNYFMSLSAFGALGLGYWLRDNVTLNVTSHSKGIGTLFLAAGTLNIVLIVVGICSGRRKARRALVTYFGGLVLLDLLYVACGCYAFAISGELALGAIDLDKDEVSCSIGLTDCCCCDLDEPLCPEWTVQELVEYVEGTSLLLLLLLVLLLLLLRLRSPRLRSPGVQLPHLPSTPRYLQAYLNFAGTSGFVALFTTLAAKTATWFTIKALEDYRCERV